MADSLRRRMREVFTRPLFDAAPGLSREEQCRRAYEQLRVVNQEFGPGTDLLDDPARLFALFEWAALTGPALPFAMLVHYTLALATLVGQRGQDPGILRRQESLSSLAAVGTFMITEVGRGSSQVALRTEATYDARSGDFVLHTPASASAKMSNVGLAGVPKTSVVLARLKIGGRDRGVFAFAVPVRDAEGVRPGMHVEPLAGMPLVPIDTCVVTFDRLRVPCHDWLSADASIDDSGDFHDDGLGSDARTLRTLAGASLCWTAQTVALASAARGCVTIALRHAFRRVTMARQSPRVPAIAHRNQQRPLLGALAEAYALTHLANDVAARYGTSDTQRVEGAATPWVSVHLTSTLAKAMATRGLERIANRCRQSYGVMGLMTANRVIDYQFLGHAFHSAGGDNQLILLDTARALAAVARSAREGGDDETPGGLIDAWELRAHQQYNEQDGQYDAALALAEAHGAGLIWRASQNAATAAAAAEPQAADLLRDLATYHALETLHEHSGWLLATKTLTPDQASDIPSKLDDLCDTLLPHALSLLDAFEIPDELLGAPITPPAGPPRHD